MRKITCLKEKEEEKIKEASNYIYFKQTEKKGREEKEWNVKKANK